MHEVRKPTALRLFYLEIIVVKRKLLSNGHVLTL
jgi:hypothetical protein